MKLTESKPKTLGDWGYLAIEKHLKKTLKHENDVLKDKAPEALHQMRVGMRRLRSAIAGFDSALSLPKASQEGNVAKIARRLGELRDLDVLKDALNRYYLMLPKTEQKVLDEVLDDLKKQRQKTLEQVQETLTHKHYEKLKKGFKSWLDEPSYKELALISIQEVLPDLLAPEISKFLLHPGWVIGVKAKDKDKTLDIISDLSWEQVNQLLDTQGILLHSLRKQSKRARYQMELFSNFYNFPYNNYLNDIKTIQEVLGKIQDSVVLTEFLTDSLDKKIKLIPTFTTQLSQSRYQAWQEWQQLQKKYLKTETRQGLHQVVLNPVELIEISEKLFNS